MNSLKDMKIDIEELNNGFKICGSHKLYYTNNISSYSDHRLAMMIYSSQILSGNVAAYDKCIDVSFPEFHKTFESVIVNK